MMREATRIEIEFDDGTIEYAEGDAAAAVYRWYQSGESMNLIHGARYSGPQMKVKPVVSAPNQRAES